MDKREAGFKFGVNRTKFIRQCGELPHNGRTYKLALVEADNSPYYALRLYNGKGKFIKQFMFEIAIIGKVIDLLEIEELRATRLAEANPASKGAVSTLGRGVIQNKKVVGAAVEEQSLPGG